MATRYTGNFPPHDGQIVERLQDFSGAYLDDLIVYSYSWEDHVRHLDVVLQRLKEVGLTAKPGKRRFGMGWCSYLGHVVGGGEVRVEQSKVEAVERISLPRTKKVVRMFLGLTGYYRRFVLHYSAIAAPLSDMIRKTKPNQVQWTLEGVTAFE